MTYDINIANGNSNQTIFSRSFFALGNDLQLELIAANNTNTTRWTFATRGTNKNIILIDNSVGIFIFLTFSKQAVEFPYFPFNTMQNSFGLPCDKFVESGITN
jgi:hypothetical protein